MKSSFTIICLFVIGICTQLVAFPSQSLAQLNDRFVSVTFTDGITNDPISLSPADGVIRCRSTAVNGGSALEDDIEFFENDSSPPSILLDSDKLPYVCRTTLDTSNFAAAPFVVQESDFPNDSSFTNKNLLFFNIDTPIEVTVRDQNGDAITGVPFRVEVIIDELADNSFSDTPLSDFRIRPSVNPTTGEARFNLVGNQSYRFILRPGAGATEPGEELDFSSRSAFKAPNDAGTFYLPKTFTTVDVPVNEITRLDLRADRAEAALELTLLDSEGSNALEGFFNITAQKESDDSGSFEIDLNSSVSAGKSFLLPVPNGRTYTVSAGTTTSSPGSTTSSLQPSPLTQEIPDGNTSTFGLDFNVKSSNYTLTVNVSALDSSSESVDPSEFGFLACFAYNARGESSYSQEFTNTSTLLPLFIRNRKKAENFRIGCFGIQSTSTNSRRFFGETNFRTTRRTSNGSVDITINDAGASFAEVTESAPVTSSNSITFPDGETTIDIPSGALGAAGTASIAIKTASGFRSDTDSVPLLTWDITPTLNGNVISEPSDTSEICIPIDEEDVSEVGATTSSVFIARYDEEEQRWIPTDTSIVGEEGNLFACGSVDHFSIFGTIIDVAQELINSVPSDMSVRIRNKNQRRKRCRYTWTAPDSDFASTITYVLRSSRVKKRTRCNNLTEDDFTETEIESSTSATTTTRRACCGEVIIKDAETATDRVFRKARN